VIFENLKLFRDIAQMKSISRGAMLNEVSQSAASQYMQEMERRLGVSLLDRTTRPLALTPAGKLFFDLCRDVLRREEQFQVHLDKLKGLVEGAVRVASIYSIGLSEMSRLQDEFAARFPHTQLHVDYLRPDKVYEAVMADQADLGLVSYPVGSKDLAVIPWREEEMAVAVPPSHPLAKEQLALPSALGQHAYINREPGSGTREVIDRYLAKAGVAPDSLNVMVELGSPEAIKGLVATGLGFAIMSRVIVAKELQLGQLVQVPLRPRLIRNFSAVYPKERFHSRLVAAFLAFAKEQLASTQPLAA